MRTPSTHRHIHVPVEQSGGQTRSVAKAHGHSRVDGEQPIAARRQRGKKSREEAECDARQNLYFFNKIQGFGTQRPALLNRKTAGAAGRAPTLAGPYVRCMLKIALGSEACGATRVEGETNNLMLPAQRYL